MKEKHYNRLDFIRFISCIFVLLYHIGLLKGGYLAVCTFFVLSGYLSVVSAFKKEKFSFKSYYLSRLKKVYLPLLIVVFLSIFVISLFPSIDWMNLKPETNSVLFGYNNFWQLNANLDYFVRNISSPFMHFWYIAILLQFEIIFPFIFIILKKIGEKTKKIVPLLLILPFCIISFLMFYNTIKSGNIMEAYYGTINRLFSLAFGVLLGFFHVYFKPIVIKEKILNNIIFYIYSIVLLIMCIFVDSNSSIFNYSMLISTLLSARLIDYAVSSKSKTLLDQIFSIFSKISYEIYLVQYPVIFLFQNIEISGVFKNIFIILITILVSFIIHSVLHIRKKDKAKAIKVIGLLAILGLSIWGMIIYITTKDYTKDMKKLEEELAQNRLLIEEKQKEYLEKQQTEQEEWNKVINDLENGEQQIEELVHNLSVVGIGDSIMELAIKDLYKQFPNGYFDAKTNRIEREAKGILTDLKNKGILKDIVIMNLGTNGQCLGKCKEDLMEVIKDKKVYWVNATNPDYRTFNPSIEELTQKYDNVKIIDWVSVATEHPEYLIRDKVHPTTYGCKIYSQTIYNAIYNDYLNDYKRLKEEKINEHNQFINSKISFIGNDLLLGIYSSLNEKYNNAEYVIENELTYDSLKKLIEKKKEEKSIFHNVVFVLDNNISLKNNQIEEIKEMLKDYNLLFFVVDSEDLKSSDSQIINVYDDIYKNEEYVAFDKIHLKEEGNKKLIEIIEIELKNKEIIK